MGKTIKSYPDYTKKSRIAQHNTAKSNQAPIPKKTKELGDSGIACVGGDSTRASRGVKTMPKTTTEPATPRQINYIVKRVDELGDRVLLRAWAAAGLPGDLSIEDLEFFQAVALLRQLARAKIRSTSDDRDN